MDVSTPRTAAQAESSPDAPEPLDQLAALVYDELRAIAHHRLARDNRHASLSTTGLVHEAYIKLAAQAPLRWHDRPHFFAVASLAMRHVLVDAAKARLRVKRGGAQRPITFDETEIGIDDQADALLQLHDALERVSEVEPRIAKVVELRFFGGLAEEEIAETLGVTTRTVARDWVKARVLLRRMLAP